MCLCTWQQSCATLCTCAQRLWEKNQWTETLQSTQPCVRTVIVMGYLCSAHCDQTKGYEGKIPHRPDIKTLRLAMWIGSGLPTPNTGVHSHVFIHYTIEGLSEGSECCILSLKCIVQSIQAGCGKVLMIKSKTSDVSNPAEMAACSSVFYTF